MSTPPVRTVDELADLLRRSAEHTSAQPAVDLLIDHPDSWLNRPDFREQFVRVLDDPPSAQISWRSAVEALDDKRLDASPAGAAVLRIAASITGGSAVTLATSLDQIDARTAALIGRAIIQASGYGQANINVSKLADFAPEIRVAGYPGRKPTASARGNDGMPLDRHDYGRDLVTYLKDRETQTPKPHVTDAEAAVACLLLNELFALYRGEPLGKLAAQLAMRIWHRRGQNDQPLQPHWAQPHGPDRPLLSPTIDA